MGYVLFAFILAIFLNWKYKINMGLVSITAAFLIGSFIMGMSPAELKALIPLKVIFPVVSITMFYGFALENGTLQNGIRRLLHGGRKRPIFFPILIFVICFCMGLLGIDAGSTVIIMAPLAMTFTSLMGLDAATVAAAVLMGAPMGGNYMFGYGGSIIRGLAEESMGAEAALSVALISFWDGVVVFSFLFFLIFFLRLHFRKNQTASIPEKGMDLEAVQPMTSQQKKTLVLIGFVVFLIAIPALAGALFPKTVFDEFSSKLDIGFITLAGALAASCMKLGDLNTVLRRYVPWKILIMVSGISVLMGVAKACGLIELLRNLINEDVPPVLVPAIIVLIAGTMSFFSSAISVVMPTLFPMVVAIAESCDLAPQIIGSCIILGASLTGTSPFSTGGAIVVGSAPEEKSRDRLMYQQLGISVLSIIVGTVYMMIRSQLV